MRILFDLESDGLMDTITKIHCLCYYDFDTKESKSLVDYGDIIDLFQTQDLTVAGHNIKRFDIPALNKILGMDINDSNTRIIDTLPISWYLYPEKKIHGLAEWGEEFGIPKPEVEDWIGLTTEEYIHRCSEDVKINVRLFNNQIEKLQNIYGDISINRILDYLTYKMDCAQEQAEVRWKLDVDRARKVLTKLEAERLIKIDALRDAMPENVKYGKVSKPNKLTIKDGSVSAQGEKWYYLLGKKNLPITHEEDVEVEILREPGNPGSVAQIKKWLFDLGWIPQEFKYKKERGPDGRDVNRAIPQINTQDDGICPSIKLLFEREPGLIHLDSLSILTHRIGILEGWLEDVSEDGYLIAEVAGLTNTLRFIHKTIVNVPTIHKPYGEDLRGCLIVPDDNYLLCGSDVSGLEESTKHHYQMYYDPEYVKEQRQPGFDPHVSIAVAGNMVSNHEEVFYKWFKKKPEIDPNTIPTLNTKGVTGLTFIVLAYMTTEDKQKEYIDQITKVRWNAKRVNFGATYGAGIPKIMLTSGMDKPTATTLHTAYWIKNKSLKWIARDAFVKTVNGQMWLYNPISQFYYSLRSEKDKFSTLNQGSGVYCFDTWVRNVRKKGIKICGQFHDEIAFPLLKEDKEIRRQQLLDAMDETNDQLKLNVKLSISVDFGLSYAQTH